MKIFVPGLPKPGGSKRGFKNPKTGGIIITDANKTSKQWRQDVLSAITASYEGEKFTGPVILSIKFYMPRPKNHYKSGDPGKPLKDKAPKLHTKKPDLTKLIRSTEDAITDTGIVWHDDSQVVYQSCSKIYTGSKIGALIEVVLADLVSVRDRQNRIVTYHENPSKTNAGTSPQIKPE